MIPKKIHYCWFGGNPKPEMIQKCIASWKKYCPDWEIIEWNEENYDIDKNKYLRDSYESKRWAFVSDYARLDVLYNYGGIYLDTDVEILQYNPFESYINCQNVLAFENIRMISSGLIFGTEPGSVLCAELLGSYKEFDMKNLVVNSLLDKPILSKFFDKLKWNGQTQIFSNGYIIGTEEYGRKMKHLGARSWCVDLPQYKLKKANFFIQKLRNPSIFEKFESKRKFKAVLRIYEFMVFDLYDLGIVYFIKLTINKLKSKFKKD